LAAATSCGWDVGKIAFINNMLSERAAQRADGYVVYISRYYSGGRLSPFRSELAIADDPSRPVGEGAALPPGVYSFVGVERFVKDNGFPVDIPVLRSALPQN
jgi:hypothetical protein